ncbi:MAG: pseudouridine synthase [Prochlorococcus sp.]
MNKPYGVLSQFTPEPGSRWGCLSDLVPIPRVYAAGRLDADSEGLLVLTDHGRLQKQLTDPRFGHWRVYWVQVEGSPNRDQMHKLESGVIIQGKRTRQAHVSCLEGSNSPTVAEREPPIRVRKNIPTSWLELKLKEGRNRQVRRMTAAVGLPTLRLIRHRIELKNGEPAFSIEGLNPGQWRQLSSIEANSLMSLLKNPAADQRG